MKPQHHIIINASLLLIAFFFSAFPALAHVEGHMPDSVAEMEYRILLEFRPNKFETRVKLAFVLMNQDKLEEAEEEFNRSLTASPDNLQAHLGLSLLRLKQQRTTEALEMIKKAVKIGPDNPAVYLNYGLILEADNRPREARQIYNDGLAKLTLNPEAPEAEHDRQQLENALQKVVDKLTKIDSAN
jgi:Tfp pilus assembly protein PilF